MSEAKSRDDAGRDAGVSVDVLVFGGGTGNKIASAAAAAGRETVLVEKGPLGGTCLNRGCNPSKMLIAHANRVNAVADADEVLVAAGTRPLVVDAIEGLDSVDYLTSEEALWLPEPPERLVVLGGGYIAAELGYYFDALGTEVALIEMEETLLPREDGEVADRFTAIAEERHDVYTGYRVTAVDGSDGTVTATAESAGGEVVEVSGDELLVALGRRPNTDRIGIDDTGIEVDDRGFIEVDETLETSVDGVYAAGDVIGQHPFKHAADHEVEVAADNLLGADRTVDYAGMSHAVFTEPQVAGVGRTKEQLRDDGVDYVVGRAEYADAAMSRALKFDEGLVKVLAAPDGTVLGTHLVGHEASMLVHEATLAVRHGLSVDDVADTIHVHPAMNKVVASAFEDAAAKL